MKKVIVMALIVLMLSLALVGTAFAKAGVVVIKGEIMTLGEGTITVDSAKDGEVIVTLPADAPILEVGDIVMAKGTMQEDGSLLAAMVRVIGGNGRGAGQGGGKPEEPGKASSAFCSEDKQEKLHPMFEKLAGKYEVSAEDVMTHYCQGQSIGAIMLALKTSQLNTTTDWEGLLTLRYEESQGWGKIWQGLKMIGSEKEVETPPGQLKKK